VRRRTIAGSTIELVRGDITQQDTDAIVNAANTTLLGGGGVDGAIHRAGGPAILEECKTLGGCATGDETVTRGGRLRARWVIHGAVMGQDLRTDADLVGRTTRACLEVADELGCRSLALPAFGTGVGGFPLARCAAIMVEEARIFPAATLERVIFAVYGSEAYEAFSSELSSPLPDGS